MTVEYLIHGHAENDSLTPEEVQKSREQHGGPPVREIPVISWSHAGSAGTYDEMPRHFQGRVATTSTDMRAFAVTVEGDCMEPRVSPGDRVVCEPSRSPVNGRIVVAKLENEEVQLRVFHKLPNGKVRLASMKPEIYPTLDYALSDFAWIYPVKELVRSL